MKRVLLINQGKTENLGDQAINIAFKNNLIANGWEVDFAGFAQTNEQTMQNMSTNSKLKGKSLLKRFTPKFIVWLFKYRKNINEEFNRVTKNKKYDLVIIGGGQLIKTKGVFMLSLLSWYKILKQYLDCPIILAGIGADPKYSFFEKNIYKKLLSKFDSIYVRDQKSQEVLVNQFNLETEYIPDIVFAFSKYYKPAEVLAKNKLLVMIFDYKALKQNFGTSVSKEEYYKIWINLIKENIEPGLKIILGYTTIGDKLETIEFSNYLNRFTDYKFEVVNTDTLENFVEELQETKSLISGRMHGMLLGMNYGCRLIPYIVSPKIQTFNDEWVNKEVNLEVVTLDIDKKIKEILS